MPAAPTPARPTLVLALYLTPLLLLIGMGGAFMQREADHRDWLASAYAEAHRSAAAGDLITARDAFSDLVGYRDADERARAIGLRLAPLEASYADGLEAIEHGDYAAAVALLEPVATQAPELHDISLRLDDARQLWADDLRRDVEAAETARNWPAAEQTLRQLVHLLPDDAELQGRLTHLQRTHGPIVVGWNRGLWLVAPDGNERTQLIDDHNVIWPTWSPDRSRIAFLAPNPDDPLGNVALYVVPADGSEPRHLVNGVSAHTAPAWSPDGTRIAYTSFAGYDPIHESGAIGVRILDLETGLETDITGDAYSLAFNPVWSPRGDRLAFVVKYQGLSERPQHARGDLLVTTPGSDAFENLTNDEVRYVWSAAWSPLGDELLLYSLFGQTWYEPPSTTIRLLDLKTGDLRDIARISDNATTPVWSPDGSRFAFSIEENQIVLSDTDGIRDVHDAPEALSGEITWSPDGQALLLAPWNASAPSTLVDLSGDEPALSSLTVEFDSNPPFLSPPQWAPAVALPPEENPSLMQFTGDDAGS